MLADSSERWKGGRALAHEIGLELDPKLTMELPEVYDATSGFERVHTITHELLRRKRPFMAIIAFDDLTAFGCHKLWVLEDAAHGHAGSWQDSGLGSIGEAGTFSFQASKNMTAGEGGIITTNDPDLAALCESYVWAGRKPGRPWYGHYRLGWNYRMTEFQGAILLQQLKRVKAQNERRRQNAFYLNQRLSAIPGVLPMAIKDFTTKHSFHIYMFRFREEQFGVSRQDFLAALACEGIPCSGGYASALQEPAVSESGFLSAWLPGYLRALCEASRLFRI